MNKKLRGFSLAELLISLLVISIVLSAAIPTITKRSSQEREQVWKWSTNNNSAYFGVGANQSALIGVSQTPSGSLENFMDEDYDFEKSTYNEKELHRDGARFTTTGDKLVILKQSLHGHTTNMANSHISFYNIKNGETKSNVTYGGRIAADVHNLAFGRGTLLHMNDITDDWFGENTAIGHYALMATKGGSKNIALGEKTLSNNLNGSKNTAIGFLAANSVGTENTSESRTNNRTVNKITIKEKGSHVILDKDGKTSQAEDNYAGENTAVGYAAFTSNQPGFGNTALGARTLEINYVGDDNTAIGHSALRLFERGYGNTALGTSACGDLAEGNYNICIGNSVLSEKQTDNYSLSIGSIASPGQGSTITVQHSVPLITGHTQRVGNVVNPTDDDNEDGNFDKELIVNAKNVKFKPFNGGRTSTFEFRSVPGDIYNSSQTGYGLNNQFNTQHMDAAAYFNLRYRDGGTDSVTLGFSAKPNLAIISSFEPIKNIADPVTYRDLSFNELLTFKMPNSSDTVGIEGAQRGTDENYKVSINNKLTVAQNAAHEIQVANYGTQIVGTGTNKQDFSVAVTGMVSGGDPLPEFSVGQNGIYFRTQATNGINFYTGTNPIMKIAGNYVNVTYGHDIKFEDLSVSGGLVKKAIQDLNNNKQDKTAASDARLKNISGDSTAGLAEINKIEVKNYTYKKDEKKTPHVGVIAQQLQKIFPNSVIKGEDGYLRIRTEEIFYAMVNSIKELCAKLQDLTAKVVGLDKRITELEAQNKMLLEQNKAFEKRLEKLEKQAEK